MQKLKRKRKHPRKKRTGEIGSTLITGTPAGQIAKVNPVKLPRYQEGLEKFFAAAFVAALNERWLLGNEVLISNLRQNDTHDLDFAMSVTCRFLG